MTGGRVVPCCWRNCPRVVPSFWRLTSGPHGQHLAVGQRSERPFDLGVCWVSLDALLSGPCASGASLDAGGRPVEALGSSVGPSEEPRRNSAVVCEGPSESSSFWPLRWGFVLHRSDSPALNRHLKGESDSDQPKSPSNAEP